MSNDLNISATVNCPPSKIGKVLVRSLIQLGWTVQNHDEEKQTITAAQSSEQTIAGKHCKVRYHCQISWQRQCQDDKVLVSIDITEKSFDLNVQACEINANQILMKVIEHGSFQSNQ